MNNPALEKAILEALDKEGANNEANKAYLEFIKANFTIPIEKPSSPEAPPKVLFMIDQDIAFLPVFSNEQDLTQWVGPIEEEIALLKLSGVDLLKGLGENVYICLNLGGKTYKEFNPQEIARMKNIVIKFFKA